MLFWVVDKTASRHQINVLFTTLGIPVRLELVIVAHVCWPFSHFHDIVVEQCSLILSFKLECCSVSACSAFSHAYLAQISILVKNGELSYDLHKLTKNWTIYKIGENAAWRDDSKFFAATFGW